MRARMAWVIAGCLAACSSHDPPDRSRAAPAAAPAKQVDRALGPLVAAAIQHCEWDPQYGFPERCDAITPLLQHAEKADEADIVALLERADDPKRRHLAALMLQRHGTAYRTDRALATRVLAVAKAERSSTVVFALGFVVGRIDLAATNTADLVHEIVTAHPDHIMRGHAVAGLIQSNPRSERAEAIVREAFADQNWVVRMFAIAELAETHRASCDLIARTIAAEEDSSVAETAVRAIRDHQACDGKPADVIAALASRLDANRLRYDSNIGLVLQTICQASSTTAADRASAAALGARIAGKPDLDDFRAAGLYAVFACDPTAGRTLARRVRRDPALAAAAEDILAR